MKFGKNRRLTKKAEFKYVFQHATKWKFGPIWLYATPTALPKSRLGVSISKSQIKRAVNRNRVKRLVKASFVRYRFSYPIDVIVIIKAGFEKWTKERQKQSLDDQWEKLEKRCKKQNISAKILDEI